jgi:hypothetical protein
MSEKQLNIDAGDFVLERYAGKFYKATLKLPVGANYAAMLGAGTDVTKNLIVPFPHRWQSTHFTHHTSADADSNGALNILIRRPKGKNTPSQFEEDLIRIPNIVTARKSDTWGESFEREASVYDIIMDSTATDRVYPVFYLQRLAE